LLQGVDVVHAKSFREKMPHSISVVGAHLEAAFRVLWVSLSPVRVMAEAPHQGGPCDCGCGTAIDDLLIVLSGVPEEGNVAVRHSRR
jgi:hypothetical protein